MRRQIPPRRRLRQSRSQVVPRANEIRLRLNRLAKFGNRIDELVLLHAKDAQPVVRFGRVRISLQHRVALGDGLIHLSGLLVRQRESEAGFLVTRTQPYRTRELGEGSLRLTGFAQGRGRDCSGPRPRKDSVRRRGERTSVRPARRRTEGGRCRGRFAPPRFSVAARPPVPIPRRRHANPDSGEAVCLPGRIRRLLGKAADASARPRDQACRVSSSSFASRAEWLALHHAAPLLDPHYLIRFDVLNRVRGPRRPRNLHTVRLFRRSQARNAVADRFANSSWSRS